MPASARPTAPGAELKTKLVWLTLFRTIATTLLMAASAIRLIVHPAEEGLTREDSVSFLIIGLVYVLTLIYGISLRRREVGEGSAYAQVLGDVALASGLVYFTGGPESPFTFTYSLAVVAASILLFQRGAFLAAAISSVAYASLTGLIQMGVFRSPYGSPLLSMGRVAFLLVSNVLAQFLIAALAGYLSRQLSAAGGRLRASEADLRKLATLQQQILACTPSGLISCRDDGRITFINRAVTGILGVTLDEAISRNVGDLIPGILKLGSRVRRGEIGVETPLGMRTLGLTVTSLEGEGSLLIVFQDLTDLRKTEDELRRADQLAALGRLAAQLAHEIRNPLAAMRGSAQMLAEEEHRDKSSARLAAILVREADRLSTLVEDFLRFARPPPPAMRSCALASLVRETVDMMKADPLSRGISIDLKLADLIASADPDQLRQVLINLLRNAFAAAGPGGQVRIQVSMEGETPCIRVWDSAGSIDQSDLGRVFEPFFTRREGGTGLGLSTAHSIIRAHGGMIRVQSSPRQGTEFEIALPGPQEAQRADPSR